MIIKTKWFTICQINNSTLTLPVPGVLLKRFPGYQDVTEFTMFMLVIFFTLNQTFTLLCFGIKGQNIPRKSLTCSN